MGISTRIVFLEFRESIPRKKTNFLIVNHNGIGIDLLARVDGRVNRAFVPVQTQCLVEPEIIRLVSIRALF